MCEKNEHNEKGFDRRPLLITEYSSARKQWKNVKIIKCGSVWVLSGSKVALRFWPTKNQQQHYIIPPKNLYTVKHIDYCYVIINKYIFSRMNSQCEQIWQMLRNIVHNLSQYQSFFLIPSPLALGLVQSVAQHVLCIHLKQFRTNSLLK